MLPSQPQERLAYSVRPPQDWLVESFAPGFIVVHSPDWQAFALVEYLFDSGPPKNLPDVLAKGRFHSTFLFHHAKVPEVAPEQSGDSLSARVSFTGNQGSQALATFECVRRSGFIVLQAFAAPATLFEKLLPVLRGSILLREHPTAELQRHFSLQHSVIPPASTEAEVPALRGAIGTNPAAILHPDPAVPATPVPIQGIDQEQIKRMMQIFTQHQEESQIAPTRHTATDSPPGPKRRDLFSNMDQYIREDSPASSRPLQSITPTSTADTAHHLPSSPSAPPRPAPTLPPHTSPPLSPWVRFTEPEKGTFVMDVPRGWKVEGGFRHPMPGDRRPWFAASSPERIYIACDPVIPQSLCHFRDRPEGQYTPMAAGGQLLNLSPSAERMGDYFVQNVAPQCFGPLQRQQRRPRPDVVGMIQAQLKQMGATVTPRFQFSADEQFFTLTRGGMQVLLSVLSAAVFNGEYAMWNWGFWDANVCIYLAPPELSTQAEQVRAHMQRTMQRTPNLMQIYQQDEAQIAANGHNAHAAQVNWFGQEQSLHNAQNEIGASIVASYWRR